MGVCTMHNIVPLDPYSLLAPQSMNFNQSAAVNSLFYSKQGENIQQQLFEPILSTKSSYTSILKSMLLLVLLP